MISRILVAVAAMAAGVMGQQSTTFTDDKSGIKFTYYEKSGWGFGLALPEAPKAGGDFIGILQSSSIEGYAAVSLGGPMANSLLITAWADGDKMVGSLRKASGYTNPSPVSDSSMGMYEITKGTAVNSTGWQYTFLCKGCITDDSQSFKVDAKAGVFGYALSTTALTATADASATLNFHGAAYGEYSHSLADAKSADYATWAALASTKPSGTGNGAGSNTTTPTGGSAHNTTITTSNATYDYIVAGGGAAGLVVSQRLVESGASVLLLERGGASTYSTGGSATLAYNDTVTQYDVPGMAYYLSKAADTSEYCLDTASMAGCVLGGSTMINALMFVKPAAHDFDDKWPAGWKWSDVSSSAAAFYARTPGYMLANGTGVDMGAFDVMSGFLAKQGWSQTNALEKPDAKDKVFTQPPWLIQDGLRGGPIRSYLPLAQSNKNFKLSLNTKLVRVVRKGATATGVEVELPGAGGNRQIINLRPGGKVVLAGGALSTPRMLINSGIGPKEQIQTVKTGSAGVTLPDEADWIELPVGQHLQDHPIFTVTLRTKNALPALPATAFTSPNATVAAEYNTKSAGLLAQGGQRINLWTSVKSDDGAKYYVQGTVNSPSPDTVKMKIYLTHGITTTGSLGITATGATEITKQPYLATPGDKSAITNFMKQLIDMVNNGAESPFAPLNQTAEALIAEENMTTGSHFVGTARMGQTREDSVVDTNTKVWGTDNIYVVDASIHPDLPTGNTQAIVMVAAEHAAKVILADTTGAANSNTTTTGAALSCKRRRTVRKL
jgi:cellobiose dehydrogenase (acceptor)